MARSTVSRRRLFTCNKCLIRSMANVIFIVFENPQFLFFQKLKVCAFLWRKKYLHRKISICFQFWLNMKILILAATSGKKGIERWSRGYFDPPNKFSRKKIQTICWNWFPRRIRKHKFGVLNLVQNIFVFVKRESARQWNVNYNANGPHVQGSIVTLKKFLLRFFWVIIFLGKSKSIFDPGAIEYIDIFVKFARSVIKNWIFLE